MNKMTLLLVCVAFAAAGCGARQPAAKALAPTTTAVASAPTPTPAPPPPPAPAPKEEDPPAEEAKQVVCTLPGGWVAIPSSRLPEDIAAVYINPEKRGQVIVRRMPASALTPAEQAGVIHAALESDGKFTLTKIAVSADHKSASFTVKVGDVHGKITVKQMNDTDSLTFMGRWESKNEKSVAPDVDAIVKSSTLQ